MFRSFSARNDRLKEDFFLRFYKRYQVDVFFNGDDVNLLSRVTLLIWVIEDIQDITRCNMK